MPDTSATDLNERWMAMSNGDLAVAEQIVAPECMVHQAPFGEGEPQVFRGPEGIARMIEMGRALFDEITFAVEVGPISEGDMLAARCTSTGRYRGGLPGATATAGTPVF